MKNSLKIALALLFVFLVISCDQKDINDTNTIKAKVDLLSDVYPGWAICYSGYREGQDPTKRIYPTRDEVKEDLKILSKKWKVIRTYGVDQNLVDVLDVIDKENLDIKVLLGMWLDGAPKYKQDNDDQVKQGIELANQYKDIVIAVNVANESQIHWSAHKLEQDRLIDYIKEVKSKVDVPVTTADTWDYWTNLEESQNVIDNVDFIAAHIYPIWGRVDIDKGMEVTKKTYDSLKTLIPNKKIIITEAGWASYTEGDSHVPKAGDEIKQKEYFDDLMKWSEENNIIVFNFSAFDEPWKGNGTEGHWGLFSADRKAKLVMDQYYPELSTDEPTSPSYD